MADTITGAPAANFIAGRWTPSRTGSVYERHNPWRPSEVVGEFPSSGAGDVADAVAAAHGARRDWARLPAAARGAYLSRAADAIEARQEEIARDMTREMGKPLRESRGEAGRAAANLRFFAGEGLRPVGQLIEQSTSGALVYTRRRPVGVVGLITPWNFPIAIPTWKTAPALVDGNTVVMKLARDSPLTGLHLAAAFEQVGLPEGVLTATRRMYVQSGIYDVFRERLLARIAAGHVGDPSDPQTEVGPLVNEKQFDEVLAGIERGREQGPAAHEFYTEGITVYHDV